MVTPPATAYSRYSLEALRLLGNLLRAARIGQKMGTLELAQRAGISRDMLYRIERGDPRCRIGAVFELAAILGVPLFEPELDALRARNRAAQERLALLPKAVRTAPGAWHDDF